VQKDRKSTYESILSVFYVQNKLSGRKNELTALIQKESGQRQKNQYNSTLNTLYNNDI